MTHPPSGSATPPGPAVPGAAPQARPAVPGQGSPAPSAAPAVPSVPPGGQRPPAPAAAPAPSGPGAGPALTPRRTAWAEGVDRLRAGLTTEPGRLRVLGAVLAALVIVFGAVTAWQMDDRATAADDVLRRSHPLSSDAAAVYRSLADANTSASTGFLSGGQEPATVRQRYHDDIETAGSKLATAASSSGSDSDSAATLAQLNRLLPEYTGLIEEARADNRSGLPLGGAYLRYANDRMQQDLLRKAEQLYTTENGQVRSDYADAKPYPWAAIVLGVLVLGALGWAQRRTYLRTNRVFNHGLLGATAATVAVLLWLVVGHSLARAQLDDSYRRAQSLTALHDAQIAALKARGNENLTLVSRGAETVRVADRTLDKYDADYDKQMTLLGGRDGDGGLLGKAASLARDADGRDPVTEAIRNEQEWRARHAAARAMDDRGDYSDALDKVIGDDKPTDAAFAAVDTSLDRALAHEEKEFLSAARGGRNAMGGLPLGAVALAVLGAAGAVLGIGRRLSEYR